jgi:hypothetical protein
MNIQIFVVFHQAIDERLIFPSFSPREIEQWFVLYAVNHEYPKKRITRTDGHTFQARGDTPRVVFEYALDWFDPALQERGFCETSCYVHLLKNKLCQHFDYVGVCQYDTRWPPAAAEVVRSVAQAPRSAEGALFGVTWGDLIDAEGRFNEAAYAEKRDWKFLLASYNRFFGKSWDMDILRHKPLTLFQTYLLPRDEFVALARWLTVLCDEVYPWACELPYETHWGTLGGYTERAESLFVAARMHEGQTLRPLPVFHDQTIASQIGVGRRQYGG